MEIRIAASIACLAIIVGHSISASAAQPIIPAFERFHASGANESGDGGWLLLGELGCAACHQPDARHPLALKQAPILTGVASRIKATHLLKFIGRPHEVKPGTTMPNLFDGKPEQQVQDEVTALVHYLASLGPVPEQAFPSASAKARGDDLYHKVGCAVCHGARQDGAVQLATSKPLGELPQKYTLLSLAALIKDPLHTRPSGRMPGLNLTTRESTEIAAYLLPNLPAKAGISWAMYKGQFDRLPNFDELKPDATGDGEIIDIAVTEQREEFALRFEGVLPIDTEGEYTFHANSDDGSNLYINEQKVVDNDGVHAGTLKSGKIKLTPGKYAVTVDFFERNGGEHIQAEYEGPGLPRGPLAPGLLSAQPDAPLEDLNFPVDPALVETGRKLFVSVGCASCHQLDEEGQRVAARAAAKPLAQLRELKACVGKTATAGLPHYELSAAQTAALAKSLSTDLEKLVQPTAAQQIARSMEIFNCYACHQRGELGGVEQQRMDLFKTTQPEMGIEGSVPPSLNGVGAKLTAAWFKQIMAEGAKDRPYMHTRMPKFGDANVGHLAASFEQIDAVAPAPNLDVPNSRDAKAHGWKMTGDKGLSCIKCHTFGRYVATGVQSIDMTVMTKRLREDWFRGYMRDPQLYRPGTRMPTAWPPAPNKSFLRDILDGDSDRQVQALWYYLADGTRARTPEGLVTDSMELIPGGEAIIYRNFIQGAGPRAIAVGYPESINIAFDANEMRIALLWQGAFIDAKRHWDGRGQGFEPPAGEKVQTLPAGATFAVLDSDQAPWPAMPPKEMGFRFRGYRITDDGRPTFLYDYDKFKIEDFPNPVEDGSRVSLVRAIKITGGDASKTLYYRAASGKVETLADGSYQVGEIKMRLKCKEKPIVRDNELLVPVRGAGEITHSYEW